MIDWNMCLAHVWQPEILTWTALAVEQDCSFQSRNVCFDSEMSILPVLIQKCPFYDGNLSTKTPTNSENAFLHWGNVLGLYKALSSGTTWTVVDQKGCEEAVWRMSDIWFAVFC